MNYIYDITLNFNKELYNFYEWNKEDNVEFYLKIPIFKVEDKIIDDFIKTSFIVDKQFLNKILNKTEKYSKTSVKTNKYSCIFTSHDRVIAINFNDKGESTYKSYLSIDEEGEILEFSKLIKYNLVDYKIKNKCNYKYLFMTREEKQIKLLIKNNINQIYNNKEYDKLKYVFYEIYNEKIDNKDKMYAKLINLIDNNTEKISKLKQIFDELKIETKII